MNTTETSPSQDDTEERNYLDGSYNAITSENTNTNKPRKFLLNRFITLSAAQDEEEDMRKELQYSTKRAELYTEFENKEGEIKELVALHCGLPRPDLVQVSKIYDGPKILWIHGSFNLCIPVYVHSSGRARPSKLAFRVPLPYKVGEETFPGNAEEKVRSEAATYIWITENCPEIPIPKLRGFGVPGGLSFFEPKFVPFWRRIKSYIWRLFHRLRGIPASCEYIPQLRTAILEHGYILIDWIESDADEAVQMLSDTFDKPQTEEQIQNLYRGLSRVMISLAKIPQPRIGSWTVDNDGRISLSNRPMFCHLHMLENWVIPTGIPRNMTYTSADSFYLDLLDVHDNRLRYQGNAVFDSEDARAQATDLVLMRLFLHKFTDRCLRDGPFVMQLTDIHASNIFVDKDWNVKHIIDLEWACSLPIEKLLPPYWLTGKGVDQLKGSDYEQFKATYERFTDIFEQEATNTPLRHHKSIFSRPTNMQSALENGRYWYLTALQTPKGLFNLCRTHLEPFYDTVSKESLLEAVPSFWTPGMTIFVDSKLRDFAQYRQEVRDIFNSRRSGRFH